MFTNDRPIQTCDQDLFGRRAFADRLAQAIMNYGEKDSIVLGLYGPWGSGKTSILNCVTECISNANKTLGEDDRHIVSVFNPWNYSDQNQLIGQFFRHLSHELKRNNRFWQSDKVGNLLESIGALIDPVGSLMLPIMPHIGAGTKFVGQILGSSGKFAKTAGQLKSLSLEKEKKAINDILGHRSGKIIVIIDDIDRLNNIEIRQIFQLVKSLGDFENTIYLLSFDKRVVLKALRKIQMAPGEHYLEKIVTVPFEIPFPRHDEITIFLKKRLDDLVGSRIPVGRDFSFIDWLPHFFRSLRDVTRYLNTLRFVFGLVKGEVNLGDLLMVTAIQVRLPRLYDGVRDSKGLLAGRFTAPFFIFDDEKRINEEKGRQRVLCEKLFAYVPEELASLARDVLNEMFPRLRSIYRDENHGSEDLNKWHRDQRICSPDFFDRFFTLSLPRTELSQTEIDLVLEQSHDNLSFPNSLLDLKSRDKLPFFTRYLEVFDPASLDDDQKCTIVRALSEYWIALDGPFVSIIDRIIVSLNSLDERFRLMAELIEDSKSGLCSTLTVLLWERDKHTQYAVETMLEEYKIKLLICDAHALQELQDLVTNKILEGAEDRSLFKQPGLRTILKEWQRWADDAKFRLCLDLLTSNTESLISLVTNCCEITPIDDLTDKTLGSRLNNFLELFDIEEIGRKMLLYRDSPEFADLGSFEKALVERFLQAIQRRSGAISK